MIIVKNQVTYKTGKVMNMTILMKKQYVNEKIITYNYVTSRVITIFHPSTYNYCTECMNKQVSIRN